MTPFYSYGCDEVGRGPLAGPVVACCASVSLNGRPLGLEEECALLGPALAQLGVNDSKVLSPKKRQKIVSQLNVSLDELFSGLIYRSQLGDVEISFCLGEKSAEDIDRFNIHLASLEAMRESFNSLIGDQKPSRFRCWVDGKFSWSGAPKEVVTIIKGDQRHPVVALASVLAKEYRDYKMQCWGERYPGYGFESHKGYGTKEHRQAIAGQGPVPIHRKSFKGVREHVIGPS